MVDESYTMGESLSGEEMERLLRYIQRLEKDDFQPIGFQINPYSTSPTLQRVDINGDNFTPSSKFFDNWRVTGGMRRCAISRTNPTATPLYGSNSRGDGLTLNGSTGYDIFVEIPSLFTRFRMDGDYPEYMFIPYDPAITKYDIHPAIPQRGGKSRSNIYYAAYKAGLRDDNGTIKLTSVSGIQPITGGGFYSLPFTSGLVTFSKGETISGGASGATGIVVDFHLTSGAWGSNAVGVVYLRQCSATSFSSSEALVGSLGGSATSTAVNTSLSFTITNAETYATNVGTGYGSLNYWSNSLLRSLMYLEYGTFDIKSALGRGVCDLAAGTGFAGKLTGADSSDTNIAENGTGTGTGTNGQTPVVYRGVEEPFSNTAEFTIGINMNLSDLSCKVLKRDGSSNPIVTLTDGTFELCSTLPSTGGFSQYLPSNVLDALTFTPHAVGVSNLTYSCGYYSVPTATPSAVRIGSGWSNGNFASPASVTASAITFSASNLGGRLEYYPQ